MSKFVICLSGGLDSGVLLAQLKHKYPSADYTSVAFYYGSKHNRLENFAAREVAAYYGTKHRQLDLSGAFNGIQSALTSDAPIPEGHYEEESMRETVVPGRNTIFAAALLGLAQSIGASVVFMGIHAGDHFIYPDCRPQWWMPMNQVYLAASDSTVTLEAPLLRMTKPEIVRRGLELEFPFRLTRTCYTHHTVACGKCGSCVERREAFDLNGAEDPIAYQYTGPLPEKAE